MWPWEIDDPADRDALSAKFPLASSEFWTGSKKVARGEKWRQFFSLPSSETPELRGIPLAGRWRVKVLDQWEMRTRHWHIQFFQSLKQRKYVITNREKTPAIRDTPPVSAGFHPWAREGGVLKSPAPSFLATPTHISDREQTRL